MARIITRSTFGRPRGARQTRGLYCAGVSKAEIARRLDIGRTSVRRIMAGIVDAVNAFRKIRLIDDYRLEAGRILLRLKVALRLKTPEGCPG
jgi:hypothetical protein